MTGDQDDVRRRLRLTLPAHWFADASPVLDGLLAGLSILWAGLYDLLQLTRRQARITSAEREFLDIASRDFFAARLRRRSGEGDDRFRFRLQKAFRRERGTRTGVIEAGAEAGYLIRVFEPARPADTGAFNVPGSLAWNVAGGWGSLDMALECILTARAQTAVDESELRLAIIHSLPAGGVAWLRIER